MSQNPPPEIVTVEKLDPQMVILAYVGFSDQYKPLTEETAQWIQHNFKGVEATVSRDKKKLKCPVDEILPGDTLLNLYRFPDNKKKLTHVTSGFVKELKKRGFLKFQVKRIPKKSVAKQRAHQKAVFEGNEFLEKVRKGVEAREKAVDAVKDMMENARKGKADAAEVKQYIHEITSASSSEAVQAIASLKQSDQTYAHCVDAAAIFQAAYYSIIARHNKESVFEEPEMALLGGFMHDIGKSKVPKDILESTVRFERESREMKLLQGHAAFGAEILAGMNMPDHIVNIAHYHHVKVDTSMNSSYPKKVNYEDVFMETRLASIVDVYQALVGKRSYKKSWAPPAAMRFIGALAGIEFDSDVWDDFLIVNGVYPKSSVVKLTDGTIGFVVSVPQGGDLERPAVAIVLNAKGERLQNHTLVDLAHEQELAIEEDLDHNEIFGDDAFDIFSSIILS